MRRSALGYNFYVNPFSSRAADVFPHFAHIIYNFYYSTNLRYYWYAWQQNIIVSLTLTVTFSCPKGQSVSHTFTIITSLMKSTKVLNPPRCIMRVTRNTHARTREKRMHAVQTRMLYRYAATSFSETVYY